MIAQNNIDDSRVAESAAGSVFRVVDAEQETAVPADGIVKSLSKSAKSARPPARRGFSKSVANFWLDLFLAAVFVALCSVAAVLQFAFPAASLAKGWTLWGLTYEDVAAVQFGILCVLAAGIILHVMLHWTWVCGMLTRGRPDASLRTDDGIRTIVGVGVLIALLHVIGGVLLAAMLSIQQP
jgi:hypothetical protein